MSENLISVRPIESVRRLLQKLITINKKSIINKKYNKKIILPQVMSEDLISVRPIESVRRLLQIAENAPDCNAFPVVLDTEDLTLEQADAIVKDQIDTGHFSLVLFVKLTRIMSHIFYCIRTLTRHTQAQLTNTTYRLRWLRMLHQTSSVGKHMTASAMYQI